MIALLFVTVPTAAVDRYSAELISGSFLSHWTTYLYSAFKWALAYMSTILLCCPFGEPVGSAVLDNLCLVRRLICAVEGFVFIYLVLFRGYRRAKIILDLQMMS
jgi:hypothetical protein